MNTHNQIITRVVEIPYRTHGLTKATRTPDAPKQSCLPLLSTRIYMHVICKSLRVPQTPLTHILVASCIPQVIVGAAQHKPWHNQLLYSVIKCSIKYTFRGHQNNDGPLTASAQGSVSSLDQPVAWAWHSKVLGKAAFQFPVCHAGCLAQLRAMPLTAYHERDCIRAELLRISISFSVLSVLIPYLQIHSAVLFYMIHHTSLAPSRFLNTPASLLVLNG